MSKQTTANILRSITGHCFGVPVTADAQLEEQIKDAEWARRLSQALGEELGVEVTAAEIESAGSLLALVELVQTRLDRDQEGRTLVDTYTALEKVVTEELAHEINYHWHATWRGDLLDVTDSLEDVEIVIRMEERFGFSLPDKEIEKLQTVAQTVRYLRQRERAQSFTLRQRPTDVCQSAFVFHELRRLILVRGGVPRTDIRLDTRLGDLIPTWHSHFWTQMQTVFGVDLPHGNFLTRMLGVRKRTTIKELVALIANSLQTDTLPADR